MISIKIVICLLTEHLGNVSVRSRSNWNLEVFVFKERGKPENLEKNLPEQGKEPTTNSTTYGVDARI